MHKIIQHYSLLITLFLCASAPSYANTEKRPSPREQRTKQNEKAKNKEKGFTSYAKVFKGVITVVVLGIIFFAVKNLINSTENKNHLPSVDKSKNNNNSNFTENTQINQQQGSKVHDISPVNINQNNSINSNTQNNKINQQQFSSSLPSTQISTPESTYPDNISPASTQSQISQKEKLIALSTELTKKHPERKCLHITTKHIDMLYDQNKKLFDLDIVQPRGGPFDLDDKKTKNWVEKMKNNEKWNNKAKEEYDEDDDNKILSLPKEYINQLNNNYVTWDAFKKQVIAVGNETAQVIGDPEKGYKDIYFLVAGSIENSNMWCFFVLWKYIKDAIPKNANCHFISRYDAQNIDRDDSVSGFFAYEDLKSKYKNKDALVLYFDDMSYSGAQIYHQIEYFRKHGFPSNFYMGLFFVTHTAKRKITGMDEKIRNPEDHFDEDYIKGEKKHWDQKYENIDETEFFNLHSPIKFMKATKVIREMVNRSFLLGSKKPIITPIILATKLADNESTYLCVNSYSLTPMGSSLTETQVNKFKAISLFKGHEYSEDQQKKIRKLLFHKNASKKWLKNPNNPSEKIPTYCLIIPKKIPNELLPIQPIYSDTTYNFMGAKFNNNNENQTGIGIFQLMAEKLKLAP